MALKNLTPQALPVIDPAVEVHAGNLQQEVDRIEARRRKVMNMTPGERRKWERDKERNTVSMDLPLALSDRLRQMADQYGVPVGHIAALWMLRGMEQVTHAEIIRLRVVSPSPRFKYFLNLSDGENGE